MLHAGIDDVTKDEQIIALQDRIEELEDLLGTSPPLTNAYCALGLPPHQRRMLGLLMKRTEVTREQMIIAVWGDGPEAKQPDLRTIDVHISNIRKKLKSSGAKITTLWGEGFMMTPADKQKLRDHLATYLAKVARVANG